MLINSSKFALIEKLAFWGICGYGICFSISIAASNMFLGVAAALAVITAIIKAPAINIPKPYLRAFCIYFGVVFILMFFSADVHAALQRFTKNLSKLIPFLAVLAIIKNKEQINKLMFCMVVSIAVASLYAIWQGVSGDYRAASFFSHPMYLAGLLVQVIPILLLLVCHWKDTTRYYASAILILTCMAMLFNGTRGAWGALLLVLPLISYLYFNNLRKLLLYFFAGIILLTGIFYAVPGLHTRAETVMDYQSNQRILMWKSAWQMFRDHPLIGVGVGNYEYFYQNQYILPEATERKQGHAHNNFIMALAETGIVGFIAFGFMFGSFLFYSFKDWVKSFNIGALMFFAATCGLLLQGMTETNFGNGIVMNFYYTLLAMYIKYTNAEMNVAS